MDFLGTIVLIASAVFLAAAIYCFVITLGYRKSKTGRTTAWLVKAGSSPKNAVRGRTGGNVRRNMRVSYTYIVDGKKYGIEYSFNNTKPGKFSKSVKVVYQAEHPERAYLKGMTYATEPVLFVVFTVLTLACVICGVNLLMI